MIPDRVIRSLDSEFNQSQLGTSANTPLDPLANRFWTKEHPSRTGPRNSPRNMIVSALHAVTILAMLATLSNVGHAGTDNWMAKVKGGIRSMVTPFKNLKERGTQTSRSDKNSPKSKKPAGGALVRVTPNSSAIVQVPKKEESSELVRVSRNENSSALGPVAANNIIKFIRMTMSDFRAGEIGKTLGSFNGYLKQNSLPTQELSKILTHAEKIKTPYDPGDIYACGDFRANYLRWVAKTINQGATVRAFNNAYNNVEEMLKENPILAMKSRGAYPTEKCLVTLAGLHILNTLPDWWNKAVGGETHTIQKNPFVQRLRSNLTAELAGIN